LRYKECGLLTFSYIDKAYGSMNLMDINQRTWSKTVLRVCESIHNVGLEGTSYYKEETNLKGFKCLFLYRSFLLELNITLLYFRAQLFLLKCRESYSSYMISESIFG